MLQVTPLGTFCEDVHDSQRRVCSSSTSATTKEENDDEVLDDEGLLLLQVLVQRICDDTILFLAEEGDTVILQNVQSQPTLNWPSRCRDRSSHGHEINHRTHPRAIAGYYSKQQQQQGGGTQAKLYSISRS